jgi:membrane fusion protein, copper/silver efflux system
MKIVSGGVLLIAGVLLGGWLVSQALIPQELLIIMGIGDGTITAKQSDSLAKTKEILYWVAPMDPNYRRDKPGQSPMGMDLIPVYAGGGGSDSDDGTDVIISASVVNNLGVRTAKAQHVDLERRIDTVGYVAFDETNINHIHLRTDGWIEKLVVKTQGERVKKGQLLFTVYSPTLVNAQEEYLQSVSTQNKKLMNASELRLQSLGMSRGQIAQIHKSGKVRLQVAVYSPQDGIVSKLNIRQGMRVTPKTTIMSLADLHHIWLQTEIFERQADWVTLGGRAEATLSYLPGKTWKGKVDYIYPILTEKTRTLKARLRFLNPQERMKPNMYAKVSIFGEPKKNTLAIPREAVIRSGKGERIILALGEGRYKAKMIRTGMESNGLIEVLWGLKSGDRVVTSAQFLIDSQASLSGSIERMEEIENPQNMEAMEQMPKEQAQQQPQAAPIAGIGVLRKIIKDERKIKITHEPIPALKWPTMTMDFPLASGISVTDLKTETKVSFQLRKIGEFEYKIVHIKALSVEATP